VSNELNIRSPQAPGDIMPVPLAERPVTDLGAPSNVAATLAAEGIRTVGQLLEAFPDEDFTAVPGVGPGRQETMTHMLEAYRG
jgi:hypothetical protein